MYTKCSNNVCDDRDHADGNEKLNALHPGLTFYGGDKRIKPNSINLIRHGDTFKVKPKRAALCLILHTPLITPFIFKTTGQVPQILCCLLYVEWESSSCLCGLDWDGLQSEAL